MTVRESILLDALRRLLDSTEDYAKDGSARVSGDAIEYARLAVTDRTSQVWGK